MLFLASQDPCIRGGGAECVNLHVEWQTPVLLLHGLVDLLGADNVLDYPPVMSARLPPDDDSPFDHDKNLWGNGYTYAR